MWKKAGKKNRSLFYRVSAWLHLWLGLVTGLVIIVVSLTGAILVFEDELRLVFQPYQKVSDNGKAFLPPSSLAASVRSACRISGVSALIYRGRNRSAVVPWYGDRKNYLVNYVDPYTGKMLYSQRLDDDFFRIIIIGHYQLWLPRPVGKPIVAYSTLIFVLVLISGLVLWWPRKWNKSALKQGFLVKTKGTLKRLNYDLHNVLGFYSIVVALVLALTGMVFGMEWFSKSVYWTASAGAKQKPDRIASDTTLLAKGGLADEDVLYRRLQNSGVDIDGQILTFGYPFGKAGTWSIGINPTPGKRYTEQRRYFEQHSLKLLKTDPSLGSVNAGEKLSRLNYDLHVGSIGGLPTKIIAFLVCVICASLPVTGLIVWLGKKSKKAGKVLRSGKCCLKLKSSLEIVHPDDL